MTPEETLAAAERVRQVVEGDQKVYLDVNALEDFIRRIPSDFTPAHEMKCNCGVGTPGHSNVCMNVACPHRVQVTC